MPPMVGMRYRLAMQLEDHLGDIIRKGRTASGVALAAAAAAAGISETELAALEETGKPPGHPVAFSALATLVSLNPQKLEGIARGWVPSA
ncbi:MAG TPA: hypothetical protein VF988_17720, partial [Verrucomicrobiae bacterium]